MNGLLQLRETWVSWITRLLAPLTVKRFTDCVAQVNGEFLLESASGCAVFPELDET